MQAAVEIACSRAFGGRLEAGFGEKWLCLITRILHAITRFYTMFLAGNVNMGNGVLESWSNGVPEGWGGQKRVRLFSKWEKAG